MHKMMYGPLLFALALANNNAAEAADRTADLLEDAPSEDASQDVSLILSGVLGDYNNTYFTDTFVPGVRTAANISNDIVITFKRFRAGSVIVDLGFTGASATAVAAAANTVVTQANTAGSNLLQAFPFVTGAVAPSPPIVPPPGGDDGLSGGAIAGIVIGVLVGLTLIAVGVWYFCCKDKVDPEEIAGDDMQEKPGDQPAPGPTDPANPEAAVL